jgi:polyisoprenyl-phosphate glycosyltransferase
MSINSSEESQQNLSAIKIADNHLISIVVPVYNEELCIEEMIIRLDALKEKMSSIVQLEFIFVNDGSVDKTGELLKLHAEIKPYLKLVELSRNFGHQIAVTAGIDVSKGDFIVIIDGDLQDPPELIEQMYFIALEGFDVVYGQRQKRLGESVFKRVSALVFYRTLKFMSDTKIPVDTGDFRLISRRVVVSLAGMRERHRFLRGMIPWIGFKSTPLLYERDIRRAGTTKYPMQKMLSLAINALMSFSSKPLILFVRLGLITASIGILAGLYLLYLKLFTETVVPGITSVLISIAIFNGLQISILGIVGTYIAKLFDEIKGRPLYVVAQSVNI